MGSGPDRLSFRRKRVRAHAHMPPTFDHRRRLRRVSRMKSLIAFPLLVATASLWGGAGPETRDGEVAVRLVTPVEQVAPGGSFPVGVRFAIDEGWHIYWRNSGDTGQPPLVEWALPEGARAGDFHWPYPEVYRNAGLVDFTYSGEVVLYTEITVPEDWPAGEPFPIEAEIDWLMCEEICIPGAAAVSLAVPTGAETLADPAERERFEETRRTWPAADDEVVSAIRFDETRLQLRIEGLAPAAEAGSGLFFFPVDPVVAPAGEQEWTFADGVLTGTLARSEYAESLPGTVTGVLYRPDGWPSLDGRKALWIKAGTREGGIAGSAEAAGDGETTPGGLVGLLALAFAGGAILNLMPCVFPVLGLKIMGFVKQAGSDKAKIVGHGLLFTAGVLVSFWILAGVLLALRAGGAELGWGFQLQSAGFVFGMAAFLLLFALNLSGVFEIGFGLAAAGSRAEKGGGPWGSFLSGVLATVVATPCSAPFLATALAGALTLPPLVSFLTFTFIALGLAAPYLLLSLFPQLLRRLPKPGAWMETLKQFMAFPLYATVGWLIYVLAGQVDGDDLLAILFAFTGIALSVWILGRFAAPHRKRGTRRAGMAAAVLFLGGSLLYGVPRGSEIEWIPWSPETVAQLREDGRIIYVDFTARWCATCGLNKGVVFGSREVLDFVREENVALVKADWTNEDPAITRRLTELGRAAVPVNLVYLPGEEDPEILPETLTPGIVLKALRGGDPE